MLTVFMAAYDAAATLPQVLQAHASMQAPAGGWKLVFIDNGSRDDSVRIAEGLAGRLPLVVVRHPHRGKNRALNAALAHLEGDLAVFTDADAIPDPDWLVQLRAAADQHPEYAVFAGTVAPIWELQPDPWIQQWLSREHVYFAPRRNDGPCAATRVWGANMAIRSEWITKGYRFDERFGPDGTATYSMGGETELTLRLVIAERIKCWHCKDARVGHLIRAEHLNRAALLRRGFRLGRGIHRESRQLAAGGLPAPRRDWTAMSVYLARALARALVATDGHHRFATLWQASLWGGGLCEALMSVGTGQRARLSDAPGSAAATSPVAILPAASAPLVSVILPTYQRAALISRAIRSVLAQTYTNFELIVVDDGSTDGTAAAVAQCSDTRLRYVRLDRNRGAAAARNAGIRQAGGTFIAFQDSDDEWLPLKLERHMDAFAGCGPEVGVVYSDMERVLSDGSTKPHRSPAILPGVLIDPDTRSYQVAHLGVQSTVIRRECLTAVGGFDERFPALEDLELFIRLTLRYRFHQLRMALVRYHETDGLSRNAAANVAARSLLLELYASEIAASDGDFAARERESLRLARRKVR